MKAAASVSTRQPGPSDARHAAPAGLAAQRYPASVRPGSVTPQAIAASPRQAAQHRALAGLPVQLKCSKCGAADHRCDSTKCPRNRPTNQRTLAAFATRAPQPTVTTAPVTTAPVTTAPVTTAPVTTAPVTTAPVTTAPVTTAPSQQSGPLPPSTTTSSSGPLSASSPAPQVPLMLLSRPQQLARLRQEHPQLRPVPDSWMRPGAHNPGGAPLALQPSPQSTPDNSDNEEEVEEADHAPNSYIHLNHQPGTFQYRNDEEGRHVEIDDETRTGNWAAARLGNSYIDRLPQRSLRFNRNAEDRERVRGEADKLTSKERKDHPRRYAMPDNPNNTKRIVGHVPDSSLTGLSHSPMGLLVQTNHANSMQGPSHQGSMPHGFPKTVRDYLVTGRDGRTFRPTLEGLERMKERKARRKEQPTKKPRRPRPGFADDLVFPDEHGTPHKKPDDDNQPPPMGGAMLRDDLATVQ